MSNQIQNKLLSHEVNPPAGTWDKIAASLDEAELNSKFPALLYNTEVIPAPHNWEAIRTALDKAETPVFAETLYHAEVIPPATAWTAIEESLITEEKPERRKVIPWFRYAAAAAIAALMILGVTQVFKQPGKTSGTTKEIVSSGNPAPLKPNEETIINSPSSDTLSDQARDEAALEESKKTFASLDMNNVATRIKQTTRHYSAEPLELSYAASDLNPASTYQELPCNEIEKFSVMHSDKRDNPANRYITLMTPDGNIIRMSKKWSKMVCCVAGEEEDKNCQDQLKKWRDKIATPNVASSSNFLDILTLVNSLQDNF